MNIIPKLRLTHHKRFAIAYPKSRPSGTSFMLGMLYVIGPEPAKVLANSRFIVIISNVRKISRGNP